MAKRRELHYFRVRPEFKRADCWVGAFWRTEHEPNGGYRNIDVWVCLLPMLPIHFDVGWFDYRAEALAQAADGGDSDGD